MRNNSVLSIQLLLCLYVFTHCNRSAKRAETAVHLLIPRDPEPVIGQAQQAFEYLMSEWRNKEFKILRESMPYPTCITKIMPWEELLERCGCCIINVRLYNINPYPIRYLKASTWKVSIYLRDISRNNQNSLPSARQPCTTLLSYHSSHSIDRNHKTFPGLLFL